MGSGPQRAALSELLRRGAVMGPSVGAGGLLGIEPAAQARRAKAISPVMSRRSAHRLRRRHYLTVCGIVAGSADNCRARCEIIC